MKDNIVFFVAIMLLILTNLFAEVTELDFTSVTSTYSEITEGTILGSVSNDYEVFIDPANLAGSHYNQTGVGFPIGFNFTFNNNTFDHFAVNTNGWICLGTGTFAIGNDEKPLFSSSNTYYSNVLCALGLDLEGQTNSELSFITQGTAPNRICIIQWKNYTQDHYDYNGHDSYNFQIKLYENNNKVQFAYGSFIYTTYPTTAQVGMKGDEYTDIACRTTINNWSATNPGENWEIDCFLSESVRPVSGLTYTYYLPISNVTPNPANCQFPFHGSAGVGIYESLNWVNNGGFPTGYILKFGTNNPPSNIVNNLDLGLLTTYDPSPDMTYLTTYYWQIIPYNENGSTTNCPVWSFTTISNPTITTLPYTQNFENVFPPFGWRNLHVSGTRPNEFWNKTTTGLWPPILPHESTNMVEAHSSMYYYIESSAALITPPVIIPSAGYRVGFWMYRDTLACGDRVDLVHNNQPNATNGTVLGTVHSYTSYTPAVAAAGWYEYNFTIPVEYVGANNYFMLLAVNRDTQVLIDDFHIEAIPSQPIFVLSNENIDFGTVNIGEVSPPLTFSIANGGSGTVTIQSMSISGTDAAAFQATFPTFPLNIAVGESVPIPVTYTPSLQISQTATITIVEGPNNTSHTINLSGFGYASMISPPYYESFSGIFDSSLFPPLDWIKEDGILTENTVLTGNFSLWDLSLFFANQVESPNASAVLSFNFNDMHSWLITPSINLTTDTTLEFDLALYNWYQANSSVLAENAKFAVVISLDNGTTWSNANILQLWDSTTPILNTCEHVVINLADYSGMVKLAFYGENTNFVDETMELYIDNIQLSLGTVQGYPPLNLTMQTDINTVDLNWTAPEFADTNLRQNAEKNQYRDLIGYKVYRNGINISSLITSTSFQDSNIVPNMVYSYFVTAIYLNPDQESMPSNMVTHISQIILYPPTNLIATIMGTNDVNLSWLEPGISPANNDLKAKEVFRNQKTRTNNNQKQEVSCNNRELLSYKIFRNDILIDTIDNIGMCSYTDLNLDYGIYTYNVTAVYTNGDSEPSNTAEIAIIDPVFNPPTNLTATTGFVFVDLAWNAPVPATMDVRSNGKKVQSRTLAGYKVFRNNTLITPQLITALTYHDPAVVSGAEYSYYITAVYTNPNGESAPTDTVNVTLPIPIFNPPTNLQATVIDYNIIHLTWDAPGNRIYHNKLDKNTKQTAPNNRINNSVKEETIPDNRYLSGYKVYRFDTLIAETINNNFDIPNTEVGFYTFYVTAVYTNPYGQSAPSNSVTVTIEEPTAPLIWEDTFETQADFAVDFHPWILHDVDQSTTYGFDAATFPNSGASMSFIIFNPSLTTPATTDIVPHSGNKLAACFASVTPPNNDWMIAPKMHLGTNSSVKFWAKSYTEQYGLERFKVGISTTTADPQAFTIISPAPYVSAPAVWTEYTYDLNAYNGQDVYIGIQCVSNDAFILLIDDFQIYSADGYVSSNNPEQPVAKTTLGNNYPNPFNPETTLNYSLKDKGQVSIDIYNLKGQKVRTLVNEVMNAGNHKVTWNGKDNNNNTVASGVYFFNMKSGKFSSSRKVILMK